MDFATNTESPNAEINLNQDNILLEIVESICSDPNCKLSPKLKAKVVRMKADCELRHHSSLQRVSAADESTSSMLGFMHITTVELSYEEQLELNQEFINKIEKMLPESAAELERLKHLFRSNQQLREEQMKEIKERDSNLDLLQEQESEKMELMMEWLNFRIQGFTKYGENSSELLALKTKILNLKSKILHLQVLQNIFTETNQSLKAYNEIHKDLKDSIKETEHRIKQYQDVINSEFN